MPALDLYHQAVRNALIKDGWLITNDPLTVEFGGERLFVDLGAERILNAERGLQKIAVEIKTFAGPSRMTDLGQAIGQYILYRVFLKRTDPERELYLAVPQDVLESLFRGSVGQGLFEDENTRVFGYDWEREVITEWLPQQP